MGGAGGKSGTSGKGGKRALSGRPASDSALACNDVAGFEFEFGFGLALMLNTGPEPAGVACPEGGPPAADASLLDGLEGAPCEAALIAFVFGAVAARKSGRGGRQWPLGSGVPGPEPAVGAARGLELDPDPGGGNTKECNRVAPALGLGECWLRSEVRFELAGGCCGAGRGGARGDVAA